MSSSDPIRPLRPIDGDPWVSRAEVPNRVRRRTRREDEQQSSRDSRRRQQEEAEEQRTTWHAPIDAGTYDDHGRSSSTGSDGPPTPPQIDMSA
jgi:hypothetical protein